MVAMPKEEEKTDGAAEPAAAEAAAPALEAPAEPAAAPQLALAPAADATPSAEPVAVAAEPTK